MTHHPGVRRIPSRGLPVPGAGAAVVLVCNPADDLDFCVSAERAIAGGLSTPAALEAVLRERYPRVVVRARDLSNEPFDAWYVYRDGRWTGAGSRAKGVA